jgi:hypothetical protein
MKNNIKASMDTENSLRKLGWNNIFFFIKRWVHMTEVIQYFRNSRLSLLNFLHPYINEDFLIICKIKSFDIFSVVSSLNLNPNILT